MTDFLGHVSPERKEMILARAEELIREERMRRGRSAPPDRNQNAADAFELRRANWVPAAILATGAAMIVALFVAAKREGPAAPEPTCTTTKVEALVPVGELNIGFIYVAPRWKKRLVDQINCEHWTR